MPLDATVGGASSNSYLTEAAAGSILTDDRLYVTAWSGAVSASREAALRWATRLLDQHFTFAGSPTTTTQALRWPRFGALDLDGRLVDSDAIPLPISRATAELALELLKRDRSAESDLTGLGISEAKVGSIAVKVSEESELALIPRGIIDSLIPLGTINEVAGAGKGTAVLKLRRT